ncbi:MAG: toxin-antitoxin system HicB family antitoxin [Oceanidesulfovibrio sp.]
MSEQNITYPFPELIPRDDFEPAQEGSEMVQVQGVRDGQVYRFYASDIGDTITKLVALKNELDKEVGYSGQIRLRMPKTLHASLSRLAETEGVSLNTYLVHLLSAQAGATGDGRVSATSGNVYNLFVMSKKVMRVSVNQKLHDFIGSSDIKMFSSE